MSVLDFRPFNLYWGWISIYSQKENLKLRKCLGFRSNIRYSKKSNRISNIVRIEYGNILFEFDSIFDRIVAFFYINFFSPIDGTNQSHRPLYEV
jgi:hypothetical protein